MQIISFKSFLGYLIALSFIYVINFSFSLFLALDFLFDTFTV